jgi:hypothetical protein
MSDANDRLRSEGVIIVGNVEKHVELVRVDGSIEEHCSKCAALTFIAPTTVSAIAAGAVRAVFVCCCCLGVHSTADLLKIIVHRHDWTHAPGGVCVCGVKYSDFRAEQTRSGGGWFGNV